MTVLLAVTLAASAHGATRVLRCLAGSTFAVIGFGLSSINTAQAVGVFYADPGWLYAFDGDEAYYHDPDGPNPDYLNGDDQNQPGGQGGEPALVSGATEWIGIGQWEGSAPGDPLGDIPTGIPPLRPPAPGGVAALAEGDGTTFVRIQDAGNPQSYGWADKGAQAGPGAPRHEGNNRRILFGHDMSNDAGFSGDTAILDNGVTISFRARLATAATGPIDRMFPEGGSTLAHTIEWPEGGVGYDVHTGARGMFMLSQTKPGSGFNQMAFSLLDDNFVAIDELEANVGAKRGLVMNSRAAGPGGGSHETNEATPATANVFEIPNDQLDEWQEFWITVQKLPAPIDGNTHEVNIYHNGALTPETFQIILSLENEFDGSAFLGMGLSSDTRQGAFDVDFIAYTEGVIVPTLAPMGLAGDYNDDGRVDAADYTVWRDNQGASIALLNETVTPGSVTIEDYDEWKANFGNSSGAGVALSSGGVPEPVTFFTFVLASGGFALISGRNRSSAPA